MSYKGPFLDVALLCFAAAASCQKSSMNIESASSIVKGSLKMRKMDSDTEEAIRFVQPSPPTSQTETEVDEKDFRAQRVRTVTLINLAGMMERMDEQVRGD